MCITNEGVNLNCGVKAKKQGVNHKVVSQKEITMVFKPKRVEKKSHMGSCRLVSEFTGITLKSINRDEYSEKLGPSSRTQNIQNEDRSVSFHPFYFA